MELGFGIRLREVVVVQRRGVCARLEVRLLRGGVRVRVGVGVRG